MKRALIAAIIVVIAATTALAQVLGNINSIRIPIASNKAKPIVKQSKEITPELKPVINCMVIVDLSKELAIKPVIINEIKLISDPPKVLQKGEAAQEAY
ncbi:MAG: hypothetical protein APF81_08780 [Desulfosporosinus sp. BRH_c37]|nr:MAG: hypothetical protein APF81_08780 [Desulfosporosinus sp. BRH_c37]